MEAVTREIEQLKIDEGFRGQAYKDSLGYLTIGYGTRLPLTNSEKKILKSEDSISEKEASLLLLGRLNSAVLGVRAYKPFVRELSENRQGVIYNMAYQLGVVKLNAFTKMWKALEERDYKKACDEMRDSRWFEQTPNRAKRLVDRMAEG